MKSKRKYFELLKGLFQRKKSESCEDNQTSDPNTLELVEQLLEARELKVSEVMIPRADVVAMAVKSSLEEIENKFIETGFLRLLIFGKDLDDIVGFIHIKNIFAHICSSKKDFSIEKYLMKTIYAARSTRCFVLLQKMKQENVEVAVILDEYGGIEGVVSVEKLAEQIIRIVQNSQEYEEELGLTIQQIHDNVYILDARTSIQKLEEMFEDVDFLSEEEGEYETISGFILSYLDRVPTKGEKFTHVGGIEVEILDSTNRAIKTVKITRIKSV